MLTRMRATCGASALRTRRCAWRSRRWERRTPPVSVADRCASSGRDRLSPRAQACAAAERATWLSEMTALGRALSMDISASSSVSGTRCSKRKRRPPNRGTESRPRSGQSDPMGRDLIPSSARTYEPPCSGIAGSLRWPFNQPVNGNHSVYMCQLRRPVKACKIIPAKKSCRVVSL